MMKWNKSKDKQPEEGETIYGKVLSGTKIIRIKVTENFWDYGIDEWMYEDDYGERNCVRSVGNGII